MHNLRQIPPTGINDGSVICINIAKQAKHCPYTTNILWILAWIKLPTAVSRCISKIRCTFQLRFEVLADFLGIVTYLVLRNAFLCKNRFEEIMVSMKKLVFMAAVVALTASTIVYAEEHHEDKRDHHEVVRDHHIFSVHYVHRLKHEERKLWRGGRWNNTCFLGRCGWWWFVEGQWYFYDRPVYPYPLIISDVTYLEPLVVAPAQAPVVVAPQAPMALTPQSPAQNAAPPVPQTWYYCSSAKNYYPYVPTCPEGWQPVPAQPQAPPR